MKKSKFFYDDFFDRLMISTKSEDEIISGSVRILNIVFDVTIEGRIANIELIDISDYLSSVGINPDILKNLNNAGFSLKSLRNGYQIIISLRNGKKIEKVPYNIHLPKQNQILINSL